jgi:hypothetical protein
MALVLEDDWCVNGGAAETSVTSPSITPPSGSIICVRGSCFAGSGDDTSTIAISDTEGLTWTTQVIISQLTDGAGTIPPPIAIWTAIGTGVAMTVTTSIVDGVGFAHFQAGRIYSGQHAVTPVADTDEVQAGVAAVQLNLTAPVDGCVAFAGMVDWGNTADVPVAEAGTTDQCAIANADVQSSWAGFKDVNTGATTIGTQVLASPDGSNGVAILLQPAEEEAVTGVLDAVLPVPTVDMAGEVTAAGVLDVVLPLPQVDLEAEATASGTLGIDLPVPVLEFDGELSAAGALNIGLPIIDVDFDGEISAAGVLDIQLPVPTVNLDGELPVSGVLNIVLPNPIVDLAGNSAAGGTIMGPCGWTIPDPLCCDSWATTPANIQAAARDYAALILWAATGQQFGLCQVTVRPCGSSKCGDGLFNFFGFSWGSGTWTPYIFQGQWFNCMCWGSCCCEPRCQVRLMGDVAEVLEVTIGGIALDPAAYRVDDNHWLVRIDGECWPECPDMNTSDGVNVFEVTYLRGDPVPPALLNAAATLACEWAKACQGADCRLSSRVTSISRSGIDINMVDPSILLENNMTGIMEVDTVIKALNPYGRKQRGRIYAPELNVPRMQTS